MSQTIELARQLIACPSLTPNDAGCQEIIRARLAARGFKLETMQFGDVTNLWARLGDKAPLIVFAGHTDVVPPGPVTAWTSDPFTPTVRDEFLYGRGAADMKGGLAAMITAVEAFLAATPKFSGSIGFLITSDEEGASIDGTKRVMETLTARGEKIDYCIVGEASSERTLGDQIRVGRRGSLTGTLVIHGTQGHVAFPERAANPIHLCAPFLAELTAIEWDQGNAYFPPTHLQISNIHAGTGAANVIPGSLELVFNLRFSTALTIEKIQQRITDLLQKHKLRYDLIWLPPSHPFLTQQGKLVSAASEVIQALTGHAPKLSTGGGTSDGRFIAPTGAEVIELGPINATIHQINECVSVADLDKLREIYQGILQRVLA